MAQTQVTHRIEMPEPPIAQFLFADMRTAWFWLLVRLYAGYEWLTAGMEKLGSPVWTGSRAGTAIAGFISGALRKTGGTHPDVTGWYANFLQSAVLPHTSIWSWAITLGEVAVGVGLILGFLTGIAAFFGGLMNANYLLAGTVSTNPVLFILTTWLVLAWRVAGYWGLDRWVLPALGVPGHPGRLFQKYAGIKLPPARFCVMTGANLFAYVALAAAALDGRRWSCQTARGTPAERSRECLLRPRQRGSQSR